MELRQLDLALSHIKNYDITTKGRKIPTQWEKVEMLTKTKTKSTNKNYMNHMIKSNIKIQENNRQNSKHEQQHPTSSTTETESTKNKTGIKQKTYSRTQ